MSRATPCKFPASSRLRDSLPRVDYLDSFAIAMAHPDRSLVSLYAGALDHLPKVFKHLLVLRSIIVKPFGIAGVSHRELSHPIDTQMPYAVGDKIGRWTLYTDELIAGANDKHLDFRVSLFREDGARVVLSTAVVTHNAFGRAYLATVLPFHRFGVAKLLTDAAASGRL